MPNALRRPVLFLALLVLGGGAARAAGPGDNFDQLTPEQQVAARKMEQFMADVEKEFFAKVKALNGNDTIYQEVVEPGNAHYEIRVTRGPVLEKAAVMTAITQAEKPPFVKGGRWNRFFEIAVHPKTPKVGMLHATFVVQVGEDGSSTIAGTIDMMKAAQHPEDLEGFRAERDAVFTRHGVDPAKYVVGGCGKPNEGGWKWHRPSTCTGASIFGANLDVNEQNFDFVADVFRSGMERYFELLDKRRGESVDATDLQAQDFMRRRWLEDQLFWDVLSKNFVPYEAWAAVNAPPVVKF
jgi:coproporphyrinogen III oxidase